MKGGSLGGKDSNSGGNELHDVMLRGWRLVMKLLGVSLCREEVCYDDGGCDGLSAMPAS